MLEKVLLLVPLFAFAIANECQNPQVKSSIYFTQEAALSVEAIVSTTFSVSCNSKPFEHVVYAEWNGKIIPAAKDSSGNFQASFAIEHSKFTTGKHTVRIFDEDGFSAFRKALRTGETTDNIKTLGTVGFENKGVWKGPIVRSDLVALFATGLALFIAHHQKSKF